MNRDVPGLLSNHRRLTETWPSAFRHHSTGSLKLVYYIRPSNRRVVDEWGGPFEPAGNSLDSFPRAGSAVAPPFGSGEAGPISTPAGITGQSVGPLISLHSSSRSRATGLRSDRPRWMTRCVDPPISFQPSDADA